MWWTGSYKGVAYTITLMCFVLCATGAQGQQATPVHRIRAVIGDLRSAHQAHEVDLELRNIPGVYMSRTDFNTRNMLLEVSVDCAITREAVQLLLQPHALNLGCWTKGEVGVMDHATLDPRTCAEIQVLR